MFETNKKNMQKLSNFFERIMQLSDYKGYKSLNDFAKNGLKYNSSEKLNRLKDEKKQPSVEILLDISNMFDEINPGWLLTGKGSMLKSQNQEADSNEVSKLKEELIDVMRDNRKLNIEIAWLRKELENFQNNNRDTPKPTSSKLKPQKSGN